MIDTTLQIILGVSIDVLPVYRMLCIKIMEVIGEDINLMLKNYTHCI